MSENERILAVAKAAIENSTAIIKVCRQIIEEFSAQEHIKPKLIGIRTAARLVGYSESFLRQKLVKGELTAWQHGKGGHWRVDPNQLIEEFKSKSLWRYPTVPVKRRKRTLR